MVQMTSEQREQILPTVVDFDALRRMERVIRPIGRLWFRHEARGLERLPDGPTLVVGNHSGGKIPIDVMLFVGDWYQHFQWARPLFGLTHDILVSTSRRIYQALHRVGIVQASHRNAESLLSRGDAVLVLPGGEYETFRPWHQRNRIVFGGHKGFARVALRTGVPITPLVCVGGHEMFMILTRGEGLARRLLPASWRVESFPITLGLPFGLYFGPLPSPLPLPTRIVTEVLRPIHLNQAEPDHPAWGPQHADDPLVVARAARVVTSRMQAAMDRLAAERRWPVLG